MRLDTLVDLAKNIWRSNLRIIAMVSEMHGRLPQPNASHTWFQDPIRFEDALGRVFPIPSEYSWSVSLPPYRLALVLIQGTEGPRHHPGPVRDWPRQPESQV